MKQILQILKNTWLISYIALFLMMLTPLPASAGSPSLPPPPATGATCQQNNCDLIATYLQPVIDLLSGLVGIIIVASLIMGGIEYSTSEGDPQKSAKAKHRITNTIFALFAFFFLYAFLQFLVPNGFIQKL